MLTHDLANLLSLAPNGARVWAFAGCPVSPNGAELSAAWECRGHDWCRVSPPAWGDVLRIPRSWAARYGVPRDQLWPVTWANVIKGPNATGWGAAVHLGRPDAWARVLRLAVWADFSTMGGVGCGHRGSLSLRIRDPEMEPAALGHWERLDDDRARWAHWAAQAFRTDPDTPPWQEIEAEAQSRAEYVGGYGWPVRVYAEQLIRAAREEWGEQAAEAEAEAEEKGGGWRGDDSDARAERAAMTPYEPPTMPD